MVESSIVPGIKLYTVNTKVRLKKNERDRKYKEIAIPSFAKYHKNLTPCFMKYLQYMSVSKKIFVRGISPFRFENIID